MIGKYLRSSLLRKNFFSLKNKMVKFAKLILASLNPTLNINLKTGDTARVFIQESNKGFLPSSISKTAWLSVETEGSAFRVLDEISVEQSEFRYLIFGTVAISYTILGVENVLEDKIIAEFKFDLNNSGVGQILEILLISFFSLIFILSMLYCLAYVINCNYFV